MHPFPDCATARFVVCGSERVAPVVLSRQQNAILRRGRCKRHCVPPAGTNLLGDMDRSVPSGAGRVSGAGELCATVCWCSCRRSMVTAANKIKTAAAARPKPNDHQVMGGFLDTPQRRLRASAARLIRALLSLRASPTRSKSTGDGCAGRSFSVPFQARKNRSLRLQSFLQIGQGIPVRDAAVFCEIPSAPAISLNVRSFQIFKTSTSR